MGININMPQVQTITSINSGGGVIVVTPNATVFANGLLIATQGSVVAPHHDCQDNPIHCGASTTGLGGAAARVFINGLPVSTTGDPDTCGHSRVVGSPNVVVG